MGKETQIQTRRGTEENRFPYLKGTDVSIVPFSRTIGRLNFEPYSRANLDRIHKITKARYQPMKQMGKVVCGPFGTVIREKDYRTSGIPLIRVINVKDVFVSNRDLVFIDGRLSDTLLATQVSEGDIVVSQRGAIGSIGQFALITGEFSRWNISANLIAIKDIKVNPWYLIAFLNSSFGQHQILGLLSGQAQPKITTEDIESILVPVVPDPFQSYIASLLQKAYGKRLSADEKYVQAEKLLRQALGIEELSFSLIQTRAASRKEIEKGESLRLDADYYQTNYVMVGDLLKSAPDLAEVAIISTDTVDPTQEPLKYFKYISLRNIDGGSGEIREVKELLGWQAPSRARLLVKAGDLLVSSLTGSLDKVSLVPQELDMSVASTGFAVIRQKQRSLPVEVLFLLFRIPILSLQLERLASGAIMEAVSNREFNKIKIPIPQKADLIPDLVFLVRELFRLRAESRQLIQRAKRAVEKHIDEEAVDDVSTTQRE